MTTTTKFDEIYDILGAATIRDENPAPNDMVFIATEYLAGGDHDIEMAEEAINYLLTGDFEPARFVEVVKNAPKRFSRSTSREVLLAELREVLGV